MTDPIYYYQEEVQKKAHPATPKKDKRLHCDFCGICRRQCHYEFNTVF